MMSRSAVTAIAEAPKDEKLFNQEIRILPAHLTALI
jgi:hypothetical protein